MDENIPAATPPEEPARVSTNDDRSVTILLETPVQWGSDLVSELRVRRPRGKDMRAMRDQSADGALKFAGRLTEHPDKFIDELDVSDVARLLDVVTGFLPESLRAGEGA